MAQTVRTSKLEYARNYDQISDPLYRLALYLLGEVEQAQRLMASLFVEGFSVDACTQFEPAMLKLLWQLAKDCRYVSAEQYCKNLQRAGACNRHDDTCARLLRMLSVMPTIERAALLMIVMLGQTQAQIAWVLELTPDQVLNLNRALCAKARQSIAN